MGQKDSWKGWRRHMLGDVARFDWIGGAIILAWSTCFILALQWGVRTFSPSANACLFFVLGRLKAMERRQRDCLPRHDPVPSRRLYCLGALCRTRQSDATAFALQKSYSLWSLLNHGLWVRGDDGAHLLHV